MDANYSEILVFITAMLNDIKMFNSYEDSEQDVHVYSSLFPYQLKHTQAHDTAVLLPIQIT